ncbi:hypothetical protein RB594_002686 [Gaeumannomyces avenae]
MDDMDGRTEDRRKTAPFLLKLFFRTGAFHRPDEFASHTLPPHLEIHTWRTATFEELSHHLANSEQELLPHPCIGTRLAFRLIYRDTNAQHRFVVKDLGSMVLGEGGPGVQGNDAATAIDLTAEEGAFDEGFQEEDAPRAAPQPEPEVVTHKTLDDVKFIVGDYISCAILPPLDDGSVALADSARSGRGCGVGEAGAVGPEPGADDSLGPPRSSRGGGVGVDDRRGGSSARASRRNEPWPADYESRGERPFGASIPAGEWRRGENLPNVTMSGGSRGSRSRSRYRDR